MTTLYIVATPIGNLEDISIRALRILGEVDYILCEDTRVTKKLLSHYNIQTETMSYHQHTDDRKQEQILGLISQGKSLAMVTDAGTPGISDPGGKLIQAVIERFDDSVNIESVPGASAVTAALSISGIQTDKFVFMGFPPHKKGRQTFIQKILASEYPVVVYESKHRIIKFLHELKKASTSIEEEADESESQSMINRKEFKNSYKEKAKKSSKKVINSVVVCRELSKMHETVYRGDLDDIISKIESSQNDQKGEFVVIIA